MSLQDDILNYSERHSSPELSILTKIYRETHVRLLNPRMVSGHIQGKLLSMLSHMIKPECILEIGTFTGYSAICLAQGLLPNGKLHTIEINDELGDIALKYFKEADLGDKIMLHIGNALEIVPQINMQFDLIFIDGEKREYPEYYNVCMEHLKPGGYLLADNVLWDGKVVETLALEETTTKAILEFNNIVQKDNRVENVLLPFRDGLTIVRRI